MKFLLRRTIFHKDILETVIFKQTRFQKDTFWQQIFFKKNSVLNVYSSFFFFWQRFQLQKNSLLFIIRLVRILPKKKKNFPFQRNSLLRTCPLKHTFKKTLPCQYTSFSIMFLKKKNSLKNASFVMRIVWKKIILNKTSLQEDFLNFFRKNVFHSFIFCFKVSLSETFSFFFFDFFQRHPAVQLLKNTFLSHVFGETLLVLTPSIQKISKGNVFSKIPLKEMTFFKKGHLFKTRILLDRSPLKKKRQLFFKKHPFYNDFLSKIFPFHKTLLRGTFKETPFERFVFLQTIWNTHFKENTILKFHILKNHHTLKKTPFSTPFFSNTQFWITHCSLLEKETFLKTPFNTDFLFEWLPFWNTSLF